MEERPFMAAFDSLILCHSERSRMIRFANHSTESRNLLFREKANADSSWLKPFGITTMAETTADPST